MSADVWPYSSRTQSGCVRCPSPQDTEPDCYTSVLLWCSTASGSQSLRSPCSPISDEREKEKSALNLQWCTIWNPYTEMLDVCSDLCESRGVEQLLRWVSDMKRERTQQQHPAVHFITHLSIKQKQPIIRDWTKEGAIVKK